MPRYRIKIEGSDIELPTKNSAPVLGFFVTRIVRAADIEEARTSALASIVQDWSAGRYVKFEQTPSLAVVETGKVGLFARFTVNTAYIFHRGR